jgi:Transposase IS66 family
MSLPGACAEKILGDSRELSGAMRLCADADREIYQNEEVTKDKGMSDDERLAYHQRHSGPLMEELREWMERELGEKRVEPNSSLGKAISYFEKTIGSCVPFSITRELRWTIIRPSGRGAAFSPGLLTAIPMVPHSLLTDTSYTSIISHNDCRCYWHKDCSSGRGYLCLYRIIATCSN